MEANLRMKTIRRYCIWCCHGQAAEVRKCEAIECDFYSRRMGKEDKSIELKRRLNAGQAIRHRCVNCSGHNEAEVRRCKQKDCLLWSWRMGLSPHSKQHSRPQ